MKLLAGFAVCAVMATAALASAGANGHRTVEIVIENSAYSSSAVEVEPGETITFVLRNEDPISHEFMVGDEDMQLRHEKGTEAYHAAVPTEITIPPGEEIETTITFDHTHGIDPTESNYYACHLPGHYDYGMVGRIRFE
jgi:uncharacterized cupredoxin-like copper-binding protein